LTPFFSLHILLEEFINMFLSNIKLPIRITSVFFNLTNSHTFKFKESCIPNIKILFKNMVFMFYNTIVQDINLQLTILNHDYIFYPIILWAIISFVQLYVFTEDITNRLINSLTVCVEDDLETHYNLVDGAQ